MIKQDRLRAYDTVSQATDDLRKRGFSVDFNLEENSLVSRDNKYNPEDFTIVEFYRFEGQTDPADEAIVYAIESGSGVKGILVSGYGIYSDPVSAAMAKKLSIEYD